MLNISRGQSHCTQIRIPGELAGCPLVSQVPCWSHSATCTAQSDSQCTCQSEALSEKWLPTLLQIHGSDQRRQSQEFQNVDQSV
eukprot:211687-Amphidinium_carterae.2